MHLISPIAAAHRFPGEEVMVMADDVDVSVGLVDIDGTSAYTERMGKNG
jgi:hypothetical protein